MRYSQIFGSAAALAGSALAQGEAQSTIVYDAETKISYSSYSDAELGMTFGLALPKNVTDPFDAVIRITAPIANQWAGFSWGGHMVWNPRSVAWAHGSNSNIDTPTNDSKTGRAIIKVFDLSKIPSGGYNYVSGGYKAGYGQRNEVGICFDKNNVLWGVENSGDDFKRNGKDVHMNNPGEKINYMGDITKPNDQWYGYPTCFTVWQPSDFTDKTFKVGDWFVQAPTSSFGDDTCVQRATAPKLTLFPHSAPIDCKFDAESTTMYITYHGSWNRSPVTGFKLVAVQLKLGADGQYTPVEPLTSTTAAKDIFSNPRVESCQGNGPGFSLGCFRPAGLGWDPQGRLIMTSDTSSNGELWILGTS